MLVLAVLLAGAAAAQTGRNPFAVAGNEGAVNPSGIGAWLLAQQTVFYRMITGAVRAAKENGSAVWSLAGVSFAYGVFHAAGPGHGKAVITSYLVANERALKRGLVLSFLAALLQGAVAVGLVTVLALVLGTTAGRITQASDVVETASYAGVVALGGWLVGTKGRAFLAAIQADRRGWAPVAFAAGGSVALEPSNVAPAVSYRLKLRNSPETQARPVPRCEPGHVHDASCGHVHAPDPATLGDGFSWKSATLTVVSAGARPCSGAILVLVFALAQGIFSAGIAATAAMSLGTAITTGALAITAVLFKSLAVRLTGAGSRRGEIVARGLELLAGAAVLFVGLCLLLGFQSMQAGA